MGAFAQIGELALVVPGQLFFLREAVDDLDLIGLVLRDGFAQRFHAGHFPAGDRKVFAHDAAHLLFDEAQIPLREPVIQIDIIVKPAVDRRTDGEFCLREQS